MRERAKGDNAGDAAGEVARGAGLHMVAAVFGAHAGGIDASTL